MDYDIKSLVKKHKKCLDSIASHFVEYFSQKDYLNKNDRKVKIHIVKNYSDLENNNILKGPGFYLIASNYAVGENPCTLFINGDKQVVYRGHSYNVRERIESHLFYDSYTSKNSGRRFTVCLKLDRDNINIDKPPLNKHGWVIVTHSMGNSKSLIREAAEMAFDEVFSKPVGSNK